MRVCVYTTIRVMCIIVMLLWSVQRNNEDSKVDLDNSGVEKLMKDHALLMTRNLNIDSLKVYLLNNDCITLSDIECLHKGSTRENILELMKIISRRGTGAFMKFLDALEQSIRDEPGETGHKELVNTLKKEYELRVQKLNASKMEPMERPCGPFRAKKSSNGEGLPIPNSEVDLDSPRLPTLVLAPEREESATDKVSYNDKTQHLTVYKRRGLHLLAASI